MKAGKKYFVVALTVIFMISAMISCLGARNPKNYYVDESTSLPSEILEGSYSLSSLKYHNIQRGTSGGMYFESVQDTEVRITNSLFVMGESEYENPKYHELEFYGIIRTFGEKNDKYRPISVEDIGELDMDESARSIKRCIAVFDSKDKDTGFRLYIMDDEIWLGYFMETDSVLWVCDDVFVIAKNKIDLPKLDKN